MNINLHFERREWDTEAYKGSSSAFLTFYPYGLVAGRPGALFSNSNLYKRFYLSGDFLAQRKKNQLARNKVSTGWHCNTQQNYENCAIKAYPFNAG